MTYVLGKPFMTGDYKVAVVSRQDVDGHIFGRKGMAIACHKEPAFVVVQDGHGRAALDMTGAKVSLAEVAELCPAVSAL